MGPPLPQQGDFAPALQFADPALDSLNFILYTRLELVCYIDGRGALSTGRHADSERGKDSVVAQEYIEIRGARENNLKNVSLRIPKRKITIFTGVSGSGKSSIVFDTIATEAQRQLYENFSMFVRNFLPRYAQPDADAIENLSMAVVVDQKRLGGGSHSTVGTITDIYTVLRLLFSRAGPAVRRLLQRLFVQRPAGHVPGVQRPGPQDRRGSRRLSRPLQIAQRGRDPGPGYASTAGSWSICIAVGPLRQRQEAGRLHATRRWTCCCTASPCKVKTRSGGKRINLTFEGIVDKFSRKYITRDVKTLSERTQKAVAPYITLRPVPALQRRAAQPGGAELQDQRPQHRRAVGDGSRRADRASSRRSTTRSPRRSSTRWSSGCST